MSFLIFSDVLSCTWIKLDGVGGAWTNYFGELS